MILDGAAVGRPYDEIGFLDADFLFSPDSRRVAYAGQRKGKSILVLDNKEVVPGVGTSLHPVFGPDSRRVVSLADSGIDSKPDVLVVDDTEATNGFTEVYNGQDGAPLVFVMLAPLT